MMVLLVYALVAEGAGDADIGVLRFSPGRFTTVPAHARTASGPTRTSPTQWSTCAPTISVPLPVITDEIESCGPGTSGGGRVVSWHPPSRTRPLTPGASRRSGWGNIAREHLIRCSGQG